ncbi:MAG: ABC transporter ATP-binding protein [Candidatus Kapabacteria bacterium]|nr:ABC transporter ATP-binding protein [Ignavibacteriota bacterium]MCW5883557.1 ABC transporter ATP-binding protein [Candidatus Kapabacteria bacterium]
MKETILSVNNLTKIYSKGTKGETKALDNVCFELSNSEITGLIGPNGAGKTTLIRIIMGFDKPDSGTVSFLGKPTTELSVRNLIGYQSDLQFRSKYMTLFSYLKFHCEIRELFNFDDKIMELLRYFNLQSSADKNLSALSKGMRQKAELVAAFVVNPKLLIFDEPTAALDPPSVFELRDFIMNYKKTGATIIFSSHHLTEVEKICDRVLFIQSGQIISDINTSKTESGFMEEAFRKYETERRFL